MDDPFHPSHLCLAYCTTLSLHICLLHIGSIVDILSSLRVTLRQEYKCSLGQLIAQSHGYVLSYLVQCNINKLYLFLLLGPKNRWCISIDDIGNALCLIVENEISKRDRLQPGERRDPGNTGESFATRNGEKVRDGAI